VPHDPLVRHTGLCDRLSEFVAPWTVSLAKLSVADGRLDVSASGGYIPCPRAGRPKN
jgi:hypothetical protein